MHFSLRFPEFPPRSRKKRRARHAGTWSHCPGGKIDRLVAPPRQYLQRHKNYRHVFAALAVPGTFDPFCGLFPSFFTPACRSPPASGRFPRSPPAPPPGHWSRRVCRSCLPLPARRSLRGTFCRFLPLPALFSCICSALSFAARHFLHLLGSSFHGTSFPALFCGACSRLRFTDLFPLAISRLFRLPFLSAISHAFHLRLPRFSFCDSPRLSPALAPLFLLRFPRAFRPQFQRFSSTLFPPFPHEKNGAEAPFFCCLLTPWNR